MAKEYKNFACNNCEIPSFTKKRKEGAKRIVEALKEKDLDNAFCLFAIYGFSYYKLAEAIQTYKLNYKTKNLIPFYEYHSARILRNVKDRLLEWND